MTDSAAHSENSSEFCKQKPLAQLSLALGSLEDAEKGERESKLKQFFRFVASYDLCSVKGWHSGKG